MLTDNIKTPPTSSMRSAPFQHHVAQITLPFFAAQTLPATHSISILILKKKARETKISFVFQTLKLLPPSLKNVPKNRRY
jgi:hypothetical protein